ncbi:hypothetical protein MRX96_056196 [Rhipicephalus microplus]
MSVGRSKARRDSGAVSRCGTACKDWVDAGVLVHEVDEGQPCLTCKDKCPGFSPHLWRKVCNNCKCPRESHDVYHEEFVNVRDRIGIKASDPSQHTSKEKTLQEGYSWVPPGLSSAKIEEYFAQLPNHKVPRLGSPGEKYRDRQLIVQLPKQDLALAYCKFLERECHRAFEDFVNARNEIALDIGYVREALDKTLECHKCGGVLPGGELAVIAPKYGEMVAWHPACFRVRHLQRAARRPDLLRQGRTALLRATLRRDAQAPVRSLRRAGSAELKSVALTAVFTTNGANVRSPANSEQKVPTPFTSLFCEQVYQREHAAVLWPSAPANLPSLACIEATEMGIFSSCRIV